MFSYFFRRIRRRLRAVIVRASYRGYFDRKNVLRFSAAFLIFLISLLVTPNSTPSSAEVAGISLEETPVEEEPPARFSEPEYPLRLPDSSEMAVLTAQAVLVLDGETGKVLYSKNAQTSLPFASLTKVMTALVSLQRYSLDEKLVTPQACLLELEGQAQMGLLVGEVLQVETLLYGLLLRSASDAACVLARGAQSESEFVLAMNHEARLLGLSETHFTNTVGLDEEGHYSSASDLLILAQRAMENPIFRKIVGTAERNVHDAKVPPTRWHDLRSTNVLLEESTGFTGVKTGKTARARECLIASWLWEGREVYGVVLGSEDRFLEMRKLREWVESVYEVEPSR